MNISRELTTDGARFVVNYDNINDDVLDGDDIDEEGENDDTASPWTKSFEELKICMDKLPSLDIWKRVNSPGVGGVLGTENCRITYHSRQYLEMQETPYDSSYILKRPLVIESSDDANVLPGMLYALQSMREGEKSTFVIGYRLMFGEMGCPPRIPVQSDCLLIIDLIKFNPTGDGNAMETVRDEDRKKFSVVIIRVNELYKKALDSFKNGCHGAASNEFDAAIRALEFCNLESDAEQVEQREFLIKLYRNQAICYNKRELFKKTCLMCQELLYISKGYPKYDVYKDSKALFAWGRALRRLKEYGDAQKYLKKAQTLEPKDTLICKELLELSDEREKAKQLESDFARKAVGIIQKVELDEINQKKREEREVSHFKTAIRKTLNDFLLNSATVSMLPDELTSAEIEIVKEITKELALQFRQRATNGRTEYFVTKT